MFPCPTSKNNGQHRFGYIRFMNRDRSRFVQACRICPALQIGEYLTPPKGEAPKLLLRVVGGLDRQTHEVPFSQPKVADVSRETGSFDLPDDKQTNVVS